MSKKLSEMKVDSPRLPLSSSPIRVASYTNKAKAYEWLNLNVRDLVTAVNHYLSTYMNPKREPAKEGGITQRRNERMIKILDYLKELEKKRE